MPASPTHQDQPTTRPQDMRPSLAAVLVLLPALLPAFGLLAWSPYPRVDGAGLALLSALPLGLLAFSRLRSEEWPRCALPLACFLIILGTTWSVGVPEGSFGATRARVLLGAGLLAFLGGASLRFAERVTLVACVALLGLAYGIPALVIGLTSDAESAGLGWAGVLGNPGPLNQVLVPAGAAGIALLTRVHGTRARVLAAAAIGLGAAHAALAPVHTGLVALIVVGLVVTLLSTVKPLVRVIPFALAGALGLLLLIGGGRDAGTNAPPGAAQARPTAASPDDAGDGLRSGLAVRASIARASLAMWRTEGAVGAGRFQAVFPPYREVEETERSRDGVCQGGIREVEHPHDDWLLGFVELGLIGGTAWIVLLGIGAWRALMALRKGAAHDAALGAALLALLVNAFGHAPLLISPASSVLGFALLGAVAVARPQGASSPASPRTLLAVRVAVAFAVLTTVDLVPRAWTLWSHGRALNRTAAALGELATLSENGGQGSPEAEQPLARLQESIDDALDSAPDSPLALRLAARFKPDTEEVQEQRSMLWEALLEEQPHSFEALYQLGLQLARDGDDAAARARWAEALALQPTHPVLLRNLARLAFHAGDDEIGEGHLALVQGNGCLESGWTAELGEELTLAGRVASGQSLMARDEPRLAGADAVWIDALSREARLQERVRRADALSLLANLAWAREHAAAGRWSDAVRLYRQALNRSRRHLKTGATALRLELAAAALRADLTGDATAQLEGLEPEPIDVRDLPDWARGQLEASGLVQLPAQ